jgi:tetratricopeptide (TPR) repeat protein
MTGGRLGWRALFVLALLTIGARLAWIVPYERHHPQADRPVIDEAAYDSWARELAAGDWLGDEVFFQEPLYPYVLGAAYAVCGADTSVARGLNVACAIVFVLCTALLAARLARARGAGLVAGVVAALATPLVHTSALILKPSLFLALLSAATLALVRERERATAARAVVIGALIALAALVRGNALLLLPLIVSWPFVRRVVERDARARPLAPDVRRVAWTALGAALVLLPVAVRNHVVGGVFTPTTSGAGTNFHVGNHPSNPWGVSTELAFVRGIPEHEAADWEHEAERRLGRDLDPGEVSSYWLGETLRSFRAEPATHLAIFARKLRLALHRGEVADNHSLAWDAHEVRAQGGSATILDLPFGGWFPWGALGLAGALLTFLPRSRFGGSALAGGAVDWAAAREVALLFVAYLATLVLTVVVGRMRLPLFALALPLLPLAPMAILHAVRARDRRRAIAGIAVVLGCAALALAPARPAALERADLAEREFNLAVQHVEHGEPDAALARALPLLSRYDSLRVRAVVAEAHLQRARAARAVGDEERSLALARTSLEALSSRETSNHLDTLQTLEPDAAGASGAQRQRFHVDALLGRILLHLGDALNAARHLRAALEFDPLDRGLVLDELRALALGLVATDTVPEAAVVESVRVRAAQLAQQPDLLPELRTPARLLWAELEWAAARADQQRFVTALKILKGTLDTLAPDDPAAAALRITAARIQLDLGNTPAARSQLETVLTRWPEHATARSLLAEVERAAPAPGR